MVNGIQGNDSRYGDKEWLGFWGDDLEITITFPSPIELNNIFIRFYNANGQWIYSPEKVNLWIGLVDERKVLTSALVDYSGTSNISTVHLAIPDTPKVITQNIKLDIPNFGHIPQGQQGAGNKAWTFIDEIIIE